MYFITDQNFGNKVILEPRIPNNYFTRNNIEDNHTPRICCADTIDGALVGLAKNISGQILYVYQPVGNFQVTIPTNDQVPGASKYREYWITSKTEFEYIKTILVGAPRDELIPYEYYMNKKAYIAYMYHWNWIELERTVVND